MSAQANNFKLGLFVIGATVALVLLLLIVGSGRWFQSKTIIETYFNESVQGLDIGSKVKYRGVSVGEVTRIGFTYNKYQQDKPPADRLRYVLVEATILGRLIGTKAGGEITRPETVHMEIEKGLRIRLAPQGITGTNYLEIDYVDPKVNPELPVSWEPDHVYIPSTQSTFTQFFSAAGDVVEKLQHLDLDGVVSDLRETLDNVRQITDNLRDLTEDAKRNPSRLILGAPPAAAKGTQQ